MNSNKNIVWDDSYLSRSDFEKQAGHQSAVLWFTGLSGSGKSTIAKALERKLFSDNKRVFVLDGDNIRHGLNSDLDFSEEGRKENIRRISEVARLFKESGTIVITAFISPYLRDRKQAREIIGNEDMLEIFMDTPLQVCIERDPKGLYKKALNKEIKGFTGIDDPYEKPENPDLVIRTENGTIDESVNVIMGFLREKGII